MGCFHIFIENRLSLSPLGFTGNVSIFVHFCVGPERSCVSILSCCMFLLEIVLTIQSRTHCPSRLGHCARSRAASSASRARGVRRGISTSAARAPHSPAQPLDADTKLATSSVSYGEPISWITWKPNIRKRAGAQLTIFQSFSRKFFLREDVLPKIVGIL